MNELTRQASWTQRCWRSSWTMSTLGKLRWPAFPKKKHFQSTPSSVKIIEPSHHFSIYNPFQSIIFIISTTLSFLLPEVIFRWAAFTTFGAFWKCQGEYNNPPRKGNPSSMGPWPNSTSLNQLGFRRPSLHGFSGSSTTSVLSSFVWHELWKVFSLIPWWSFSHTIWSFS